MRGIAVENGDMAVGFTSALSARDIVIASDGELVRQTVQAVINTNRGEWFLNENEGIVFGDILQKTADMDVVKEQIAGALLLVDDSFVLEDFTSRLDERRVCHISFRAVHAGGEVVVETTI